MNHIGEKENFVRGRFEFQKMDFENLTLLKNIADIVNANYSIHFCNKEKFKKFWKEVELCLKPGGYFCGNFLGDNDSWNVGSNDMTFMAKKNIEKLFSKFSIIKLEEIEKEGMTVLGNHKHWHIFNVIAKKVK